MFLLRRFQKPPPPSDSKNPSDSDSDSSSDAESETQDDLDIETYLNSFIAQNTEAPVPASEFDPEQNFKDVIEAYHSEKVQKYYDKKARRKVKHRNPFDFPPDDENWKEEDLRELWDNGNNTITGTGWDPAFATPEEWEYVKWKHYKGQDVPIAPFYLPYRKPIPPVPTNHSAIKGPKDVIEELDRIEEFLKWVSYVFEDGSTYEGTLWDDIAQGKGVYTSPDGLVRYEGEWFRNDPEGHGVIEVEVPVIEPVPGSKLEEAMRAEGKIIKRDFMSPEEREWLDKDIEDSYLLANGNFEVPYYERDEWVKEFGEKPEKGRYRYAGQMKHGRMHGCGVYEINDRIIYGRFYFGEILDDDEGCDDQTSALHAGIGEVAAAKARMFVNKPDGSMMFSLDET